MNITLPLAEKTNIRDWDFQNLTLDGGTSAEDVIAAYTSKGIKKLVVVNNGEVVYRAVCGCVKIGLADVSPSRISNSLTELNKTKKNSSLLITIAKNVNLSSPLHIVYISNGRSFVHQTELRLEEGAQASVIETYISDKNANIVHKTELMPNAKLNVAAVYKLNGSGASYFHRFTEVNADSSYNGANFLVHDSDLVFEDFVYMVGKGAEAEVNSIALSSATQRQNLTIKIENMAPYCRGNIVNYGIVKDTAHLAVNGVGKIHKGQSGGDNQQESRLLNLSKKAEAVANPFLLIDEGDITAGHAASIGRVNEEQVYYLQSRGLSRDEAERAIALGFLTPFVNHIDDDELKKELLDNIKNKLRA